jgi:Uma2 family endonuclease
MFAIAGGSYNHSRITTNLTGQLYNALRGTRYGLGSNDLRVRVAPNGLYTYPDMSAFCGEPKFADNETDTLLNPTLLVDSFAIH